ncbi:hypothetical protein BMS3Bbin02_00747 [bacterium BMS3Bbin02]|nr:hypothetical protein BMS3Bbin02_00747 [bacterium BMS3Bbin02]
MTGVDATLVPESVTMCQPTMQKADWSGTPTAQNHLRPTAGGQPRRERMPPITTPTARVIAHPQAPEIRQY